MNDFDVRDIRGTRELRACVQLQDATWGPDFDEAVPVTMLHLVQRLGGVLAGAFDHAGALLGFVFGLPALRHGALVHWSDMLAVRADQRDRGIGGALKRYQREHVLHQGIGQICWTFEPLESRNAYVNFARLGVVAREYVRDFYGDSESPLHVGIGTDRLIAEWDITAPRVENRLAGQAALPSAAAASGLPAINTIDHPSAPHLGLTEPLLRLGIPRDVQGLKRTDPVAAAAWRETTRAAFEHYIARGYAAVEFVRTETGGWYLLGR